MWLCEQEEVRRPHGQQLNGGGGCVDMDLKGPMRQKERDCLGIAPKIHGVRRQLVERGSESAARF